MKKYIKSNSIYEKQGVFGDLLKYQDASHRFAKMIEVIEKRGIKKEKILDVGCGTGYLAAKIKEIFPEAEIYGADISKKAITTGKSLYKDINLTVSDSEQEFPFKDNFFDIVISGEHIAHLKDTDIYLSEVARVMKKGGILILTTPNLTSWLNRILILMGKAPMFFEPLLNTGIPVVSLFGTEFPDRKMLPSGHLRLFNIDILGKALDVYGIKVIKTYGVSSLNNKLIKWIDLIFSKIPDLASGIIVVGRKI